MKTDMMPVLVNKTVAFKSCQNILRTKSQIIGLGKSMCVYVQGHVNVYTLFAKKNQFRYCEFMCSCACICVWERVHPRAC